MTGRTDITPVAATPGDRTGSAAIVASGLCRTFGEVVAVDGVSLVVERGEVFGLVGPDGAGKSTLITMLATVLRPSAGEAWVFGSSVVTEAVAARPHIGYMSQRYSMYPDLTVAENLEFFARLRGVGREVRRERAARLLEQMGMERFADRLADRLSGGMKQKLMLASTLMTEPDVLFLDEPTTGVDPVSRREFWRIIAGLHTAGKTVFVATPYMDEAERCSRVAFMDGGRFTETGTPAEIKSRVPGTLFELAVTPQREAASVLLSVDGVRSAHVLGEAVRVLVADGGPAAADLRTAAERAGLAVTRAEAVPMDMEAAFAFLAERPGEERAALAFDERFAEAVTDGGEAS